MGYSVITYTGDGTDKSYSISFPLGYLSKDHIKCRVNNEVDGLGDPSYRSLEYVTDTLVNINGDTPADGVPIEFTRTVPKTTLQHDYADGVSITEAHLDQSNSQVLMAVHEFLDGRYESEIIAGVLEQVEDTVQDAVDGLVSPAMQPVVAAGTLVTARDELGVINSPLKSVKDHGVAGNGVTDDTAAIQALLNTGGTLYFPAGTYKVTGTLSITVSNTRILGAGRGATVFSSTATGHTINIESGLSYIELHDFSVTRTTVPAVTGQDGVHFTNLTERAIVSRIEITNHWRGLKLGITSFSKVFEVLCDNNYSHGVHVTNEDGAGGLQWTLVNCLSQRSNGYGLYYTVPSGSASVGEIINFSTYANKLGGAWFIGTDSSHAVNSVRWSGGFVGEDGNHGIYLNTYGGTTHHISNVFAEIAGTAACGVNNTTSATNTGNGILLTANNTSVEIVGCHIIGNSYSGISSEAARTLISGCGLRINGAAGVSGEQNGIYIGAGNACITGCSSKGHQGFGVYLANDNHVVTGNDLTENTTGALAAGVTLSISKTSPNLGITDSTITYTEGTFTPNVVGSTSTGVGSYTAQKGKYTRHGNVVTFSLFVSWLTHTGTGSLLISGLPTAAVANPPVVPINIISSGLSVGAGKLLQAGVVGGSIAAALYAVNPIDGTLEALPMDASVPGGVYLSGSYFV